METPRFTKRIENFDCDNCGSSIQGQGYTNHCPECLWSKHVDINPGDRLSSCHGLMEPIGIKKKKGELSIVHRCKNCKLIKPNRTNDLDDLAKVLKLPILGNL